MDTASLLALTFFRGRVALYAMLKALGIGTGDQVATQAFTCVAVPEAIMAAGARPLYVDLTPAGFNMDAADLARKITPQTRAVIVQHTYGIPADIGPVLHVAQPAGLPLIEDCCHSLLSTYQGQTIGSFGVGSFYSFEWGKPIVAGIGGSAIVNDPDLRARVNEQYTQYRLPASANQFRLQLQYLAHRVLYRPSLYWPVRWLYHTLGALGAAESNYNPIQADAVAQDFSLKMAEPLQKRLASKLCQLEAQTQHSRWAASEYRTRIHSIAVSHPMLPDDGETVFARYPLIAQDKTALLAAARKANVELAEWYSTPIHPISSQDWPLIHYQADSCPNAETRCRQVVTLPTHPTVTKRDVDRAVRFLNAFIS